MRNWQNQLKYNPIQPLLNSKDEALHYFVKRDLLEEKVGLINSIWQLPEPQKILKKQLNDGSWKYSGKPKEIYPKNHHFLVETWKQFRFLIEKYEFTKEQPSIRRAAEFLFSFQTEEGDIRGMIANQYATYYTGAIMSLLIKAGYEDDPRIEKGFQWLLSMRQQDLGWTIPIITHKFDKATQYKLTSEYLEPINPDRSKPFSHNWTGMVIRAFAAHKKYRKSEGAITAANLLKSKFFKKDYYTSYRAASYWVKFQFPFWWNNLVAALDSISLIGISKEDPDIQNALNWFINNQEKSGLWKLSYDKTKKQEIENPKSKEMQLWISLVICRIFKRFFG